MSVSSAGWRFNSMSSKLNVLAIIILFTIGRSWAHEHHEDQIPEGEVVSPEPLDSILWTHILVQSFAWGILFPTGMVLGLIRSRWHVPVQVLGTIGAVIGRFLGHAHKGRQFKHNVHSTFAYYLQWYLFAQILVGIYLRLHIERGFLGRLKTIRPWLVRYHGMLGILFPIAIWVQMLFGGIVALGFCTGDHLGQCAAHFIMGSAFIGYGIVLTILLLAGQAWLRWTGRSQEFFDSALITAWGCVNTFTEHHWGGAWVKNDLQHTSMGIIWWAAGLVGMWLSRTKDGRPKRNLIPAIVIILTGWGMSGHPQELMISTMVHSIFGYTLMAAGATRIIEISFVLRDKPYMTKNGGEPSSFQYLTPFLLYAGGLLFLSATEEQMNLMAAAGISHVSYILIIYSAAFVIFLFTLVLLHLYTTGSSTPAHVAAASTSAYAAIGTNAYADASELDLENGEAVDGVASRKLNGNGHAVGPMEARRLREAQEFELDTLVSDDEAESTGEPAGVAHGKQESGTVRL